MKASITHQSRNTIRIEWSKKDLGFGVLIMKYDEGVRDYILDSELIGIETILLIFKAAKYVKCNGCTGERNFQIGAGKLVCTPCFTSKA